MPSAAGGSCDVAIVAGDHFYKGIEDDVCSIVAAWLNETLPAPSRSPETAPKT
jgi:hypothetical protein